MEEKAKYKTKQREELLDYLKSLKDSHITAGDLCEHFRSCPASIGKATVYRQLEQLVDEGIVYKYVVDSASPACYEYVPESAHQSHGICFHCKCEKCGRLYHMHSTELEQIRAELERTQHFCIDPRRTVFYGICGNCSAQMAEESAD